MKKPRVPLTPPPTTPALVRRGAALAIAGLALSCGPAPTEASAPTGPTSNVPQPGVRTIDPNSPQPAYPPTPQGYPMTPQPYPPTPQAHPQSPQAYPPKPYPPGPQGAYNPSPQAGPMPSSPPVSPQPGTPPMPPPPT